MAGKIIFILLCMVVTSNVTAAVETECDCDCMYKLCKNTIKEHPPVNCDAIYKKCQECHGTGECNGEMLTCVEAANSEDDGRKCVDDFYKCTECMCKHKACKMFVKKHGAEDRCDESLTVCQKCDVNECNKEMAACIKNGGKVKECADAWHKCGKCMCKYGRCKAVTNGSVKCKTGLDLCRRCDTLMCDKEQESCVQKATSQDDKIKCSVSWYTCVKKDCPKE